MTVQEFSNEFDILYNNIMSNQAPGLNEYEKSIMLTRAQESFILDIYNGKYNSSSFESTEEVTSYINSLVKQVQLDTETDGSKISENSVLYQLPEDLWYITYESAILEDDLLEYNNPKSVLVKPVTQDNLFYTMRNPFRGANSNKVLRLSIDGKSELISKYNIKSYIVRYISKPSPIILEDLSDLGVSINGVTKVTECKLNPASHRMILDRAVRLAKALWESGS